MLRLVSSDISHLIAALSLYLWVSVIATRKVQPYLSDQTSGYPSHCSLSRSGAIRVLTDKLIGESLLANKSLYHFGIPGIFCRAAGLGGSPFFFPLTILTS